MCNWTAAPISSLLADSFPGEWGSEPTAGNGNAIVFRGADFKPSGRLGFDGGVSRRIPSGKLSVLALKSGDILLEKSGGSPDQPVGRVSLFEGNVATAVSSNFLQTLRPREGVDAEFVFYLLQHEYLAGRVLPFQQQTTGLINFRLKDYLKEVVRFPPDTAEQRRIARVLSTLDEQLAQIEAVIDKQSAIRVGLVRDQLAVLDNFSKLPLADVASVGSGVTLGRNFQGAGTAEYPYLRVANVQDGHVDLSAVKSIRLPKTVADRAMLQPGDVLMNEGGDFDKLGRGAVWKGQIANCLHQNHVFRVRCRPEAVLPEFLALWAASDYGKRFFMLASKQSTNLASINSTQLKRFPVLVPDLSAQRNVIAAVAAIDVMLEHCRHQGEALKLLKVGLMNDLFQGELRGTKTLRPHRNS